MATKKGIHIRLDVKQKKRLEALFAQMGLDIPTAVRVFFRKVEMTGEIPFSVGTPQIVDNYTPEQLAEFDRLAEEAERGINVSGPFHSVKEMWDHMMKNKP